MKKLRLWAVTLLLPTFIFLPIGTASDLPFENVPFDITNIPEPVPPPAAVRDFFDLSPFYQQWINVKGFPVLASAEVNPYALKEAAWVIWQMIGHRPDILRVLAQDRQRLSVLSINESLGDLPEYDLNSPLGFLVAGSRDVAWYGATASEENLFCSDSDYCYSFLIHEFAHTIHGGLTMISAEFDNRVRATYNEALEKGLWKGTYAASNRDEYWAEGVGSWFRAADFHNPVKTRDALKAYDPDLALLIAEIFGDGDWRYTPPMTRMHLPHLQGFNPQEAFRFDGLPLWEIRGLALKEQLQDPNSDGGGKWVNLELYHPSLLPSLIESKTREDGTSVIFVNLTGNEISFYFVDADGTEHFHYRAVVETRDIGTYAGAIWLIKDHNGEDLAVFRAEEKTGRVLISAAPVLITPGLSKISGDNQTGVSGTALVNPFVIEVRDENLSVLEGISVTFTVTAGGGTLNITHTTTDENGRVESTLTLGPNLGMNTVQVSATGIEHPVTFNATAETPVNIPDPNLRAKIETTLGKAPGTTITTSDMTKLTLLDARNANINDLTGLEGATNLTELLLGAEVVANDWQNSNAVSDLSPLAGLTNLTQLTLRGNNISDISALGGLTNLTWLNLEDNAITDLSSLTGLTNLETLELFGNNISDISPLSGLTNLTWLQLFGNSITDLSPLAGLTKLTRLALARNNLSDISTLAGLTNLATLGLAHNNISDLSPLAGLTNLARLGLRDNTISDISALADLTNLARADLRHNDISDISPLVANTGLGAGDEVLLNDNLLSYSAIKIHIPTLQNRRITVKFDNQAHPALLKISGDNQKGAAFAALSQPFVVEAQGENGSVVVGVSVAFAVTGGSGMLSIKSTTTNENGRAQSTLILGPNLGANTVQVSATGIQGLATFHAIADTELPPLTADVNNDGLVNVLDLILIASSLGQSGQDDVDVNEDGVVSILDLILVAGMFDGAAAAPSTQPQLPKTLTAVEVQGWLTDAMALKVRDPIMKRGIMMLEQLLIALTPTKTELLPNYPNPFNPETWIPYRLAEDAFVSLTIYDSSGQVVRTLDVGHRIASAYENRSKAVYWDGRNEFGEPVASGIYFYTLTVRSETRAGDFSATRRMLTLK